MEGGNADDDADDYYEVTTVNPDFYLILFTLVFCILCFLVGYCAFPGKLWNPLSLRLFQQGDDNCVEISSSSTMADGEKQDSTDAKVSSALHQTTGIVYSRVMGRDRCLARQANSMRNIVDDEEIELSLPDYLYFASFDQHDERPSIVDNPIAEESTNDSKRIREETRKVLKLGTP